MCICSLLCLCVWWTGRGGHPSDSLSARRERLGGRGQLALGSSLGCRLRTVCRGVD